MQDDWTTVNTDKMSFLVPIESSLDGTGGTPQPTSAVTRTSTPVIGVTSTPTRTATPVIGATSTPTRTATPSTTASCQITYAITNQWNNTPASGGFQVDVTIRNTGTTQINGWTLTWTFTNAQTIQNLWNAVFTQTGANVSVVSNQSWNGNIAPGASVGAFGFSGNWSASNARPTAFTLNGAACSLAP